MYLITDICLGCLREGEERILGKRGFILITLMEKGGGGVWEARQRLCLQIVYRYYTSHYDMV